MLPKYQLEFLVLFVTFSFCVGMQGSYLKAKAIEGPVRKSIVSDVLGAHDLHCAVQCYRRSGVSLYYTETDQRCYCNNDTDTTTPGSLKDGDGIIFGFFSESSQVSTAITTTTISTHSLPDCSKHYYAGSRENGVYTLYVNGEEVSAWCIMKYQYGPMTVFQSRNGGSLNFYRGYDEYVNGFGDPNGEYWLGLKSIATLTNGTRTGLYIYMAAYYDDLNLPPETITYATFRVDSTSNYKVHVSEADFGSDCVKRTLSADDFGDGQEFATFDKDNNKYAQCAESAWWFASCIQFDLNGPICNGTNSLPYLKNENCWESNTPVGRITMAIIHWF